jgi:hypothetical protein
MLQGLISALATAVIVCAGPVILASPGHADTPGCVTKAEFQQAPKGMRIIRVHAIFDTSGRFLDGGAGGFARRYRFCEGAADSARTSNFTIIYAAKRNGTTRVNTKYCGRDYYHRRSCF